MGGTMRLPIVGAVPTLIVVVAVGAAIFWYLNRGKR